MTTIMTNITRVAPIMVTHITRVAVTLIPRCAPTDQSAGHWAQNVTQGWKKKEMIGHICLLHPTKFHIQRYLSERSYHQKMIHKV